MRTFLDKIFHSDKLAVSIIVRFVLMFLMWFRSFTFNLELYWLDEHYAYELYVNPMYEYEHLMFSSVAFFFPFLFLWLFDAIWIQQNIKSLKVHPYEYKEQRNRLVTRHIIELIIPLIPFLVLCPIVYACMPDTPFGKSFMVLQWLPIVMTGWFVSGIVWSVLGVILLAVVFFIVPFYVFPPVVNLVKKAFAELKYNALHALYIDYTKFASEGICFSFESNTPYSRKIKKIFKDFNGYFEKKYIDGYLTKKVMCYIVPKESGNLPRQKGVYMTTESVFAVLECDFAKNKHDLDEDIILEEILRSLADIFKQIEIKFPEFNAQEQTEMLFKCADAFYPKDSGLKRI
ncbi:MAG: hypothetical protein IJZ94_00875 [Clostridia bacterium]|nr:hypothetical protein [Clostridia bacterium]